MHHLTGQKHENTSNLLNKLKLKVSLFDISNTSTQVSLFDISNTSTRKNSLLPILLNILILLIAITTAKLHFSILDRILNL